MKIEKKIEKIISNEFTRYVMQEDEKYHWHEFSQRTARKILSLINQHYSGDTVDDDAEIRKLCKTVLPEDVVEGDSYGVPSTVDLVEILVDLVEILVQKLNSPTGFVIETIDTYSASGHEFIDKDSRPLTLSQLIEVFGKIVDYGQNHHMWDLLTINGGQIGRKEIQ